MFKTEVRRKKKLKSRVRLWKLKDTVVRTAFKEKVNSKCNGSEDWVKLNTNLLDIAGKVCGQTKDKPRHLETRCCRKDRRQYCEEKRFVERVVAAAMDQVSKECIEKVKINCDGYELL